VIDAALALAEEGGADGRQRGVRRHAAPGVSPGAPSGTSRAASLMTAWRGSASGAFGPRSRWRCPRLRPATPLARVRALGMAYLRWAMRNRPIRDHLERQVFRPRQTTELSRTTPKLIGMTEQTLADALPKANCASRPGNGSRSPAPPWFTALPG